jgi:PEP-CTERM motif
MTIAGLTGRLGFWGAWGPPGTDSTVASRAWFRPSSLASANTVIGSIWENQMAASQNAIPANVPVTPADVTFSVDSPINFTSLLPPQNAAYTIGGFLGSGGATILTGAAHAGDTLNNTIFNFVGSVTVTNGMTFTVGHDDGLTLIIGGIHVIDEPLPTSPTITTRTYTGPSGTFAFQLVYGECCGGPAELEISLPLSSAVPEPATWGMMLLGFAGLGFAFRQSRRKVSFA